MTENIVNNEWSSLAEDDGTFVLEYNEYEVIVGGDEEEEIITNPTSINYSPSVNKAKNASFDVPPDIRLEDLAYLGEPLKLYVDRQLAFEGQIRKIETKQRRGEDYTITARPPGKKLKGSDLEKRVSNTIFSDQISKIVDGFNETDGRHEDFINTDDEELIGVYSPGGTARVVDDNATFGTARYHNVGDDVTQVTTIYVKGYVPDGSRIELEVDSENYNSTADITGLDKNIYGQWIKVNIADFPEVESYNLDFLLEEEAVLSDWVVITDEEVSRYTTSPEVNVVEENIDFYSRSGSELEENIDGIGDGILFDNEGRPRTRQISEWSIDPFPYVNGDEFVGGKGGEILTGQTETRWQFDPEDPLDNWEIYARVKPYEIFVNRNEDHTLGNTEYDESWDGSAASSTEQVAVQDSSVKITGDAQKSFQWTYDRSQVNDDMELSSQAYLTDTGTIEWILQAGPFEDSDNEDGYALQIGGNQIELLRLDAGSGTVLDSQSYTRQQGEWIDWSIRIEDGGVSASLSDSNASYSLSSGDETHTEFGEFAVDTGSTHYLDDMIAEVGDNLRNVTLDVAVGNNRLDDIGLIIADVEYREWGWTDLVSHNFTGDFPDTINGFAEVYFQASPRNEHAFDISPLCLVHEQSEWNISDFDVTIDEPGGHLDSPPTYASGEVFNTSVVFDAEVANSNIYKATVDSTFNTESNIVSFWGPSQVIEADFTDYPGVTNSSSITDEFPYAGVEHSVAFLLSSGGFDDNTTPRYGNDYQRLEGYSVNYSTNDLEILYDTDLSNNRLALMNSLAEDSSVLFRWEGDEVYIFHEGQDTTNINLKSEDISSSVSIEDVYASCEVKGMHNIRSGKIVSEEAPDFVDDHKVIRTEDVESETDAKNKARRFLNNHGSIKYKGSISTLPTFAPLGAKVDGSLFNHGQDMIIQGVRYGKRRTRITLGYDYNISTELIALEDQTQSTKGRATGKGMTIPVGQDQV